MRYLPLFLILGSIVIYLIRPPGLYDSKLRRDASRHYFDTPNETTRTALEEVKRAERIEINFCAALSATLLGTGIFLLVRSKKQIEKHAA